MGRAGKGPFIGRLLIGLLQCYNFYANVSPFLREKALGTRLHDFNFASPLRQLFEVSVFCQPPAHPHPPNDESLSPDKFSGEVSTKLALETSLPIK